MKSIALITPGLSSGGRCKMIVWVANALSSKYKVRIIKLLEGPIMQEIPNYIRVVDFDFRWDEKNRGFNKIIMFGRIVYNLLREIRHDDIVISFGDLFSMSMSPIIKIIRPKFIVSERGDPNVELSTGIVRKKLFKYSDYIVFQTEGAQQCFQNSIQEKSCVIPNPVIVKNTFKEPITRRNEISFVGRFEIRQKRQDIMIDAFADIHKSFPDFKLVFYGDGNDIGKCYDHVKRLGISDCVNFKGEVNNVLDCIYDSSVFVLTSDYEGIPNALIEAMSVGLPVVSTDCRPGGARLLINNGVNGIIVPIGDASAVAKAVCEVLSDSKKAEEMGNRAKDISKVFSEEKISLMWNEMIEQIMVKL